MTHLAERVRPRNAATFTPAALEALASYGWPGNIRELANLVERLSILSGPMVDAGAVRQVLPGGHSAAGPGRRTGSSRFRRRSTTTSAPSSRPRSPRPEGNVAEAARVLQTDRANLYRRMRRLGLDSVKS